MFQIYITYAATSCLVVLQEFLSELLLLNQSDVLMQILDNLEFIHI